MSNYLEFNDLNFKLNGVAMDGLIEISPPKFAMQLRNITVLGNKEPQFESSKFGIESDFSVTCVYQSGSTTQRPLLNSLLTAEMNGTAVTASAYEIDFDTGKISGSCIPSDVEWLKTSQSPDAVNVKFTFKKNSIVSSSF